MGAISLFWTPICMATMTSDENIDSANISNQTPVNTAYVSGCLGRISLSR